MEENPVQSKRITLLIVNLFIILVCVIGLFLLVFSYLIFRPFSARRTPTNLDPTVRPSWTWTPIPSVTQTSTTTATPRNTSTPTLTMTPAVTQTLDSTPASRVTILPSLTPANALGFDGAYNLVEWDEIQANHMVGVMQGYPAGLSSTITPDQMQAYFQSFQYPIFALQEALLRFPDSIFSDDWRWSLARNLAFSGNPEAGDVYAELIADHLNRDKVSLEELYAWFPLQDESLQFFMAEVPVPPGYLSSYLVEIRNEGGSAFIWLLRKSAGYEAYSILAQFDFVRPRQANWIVADLDNTESNGYEIAIYWSALEGETKLQPPRVFNLGKLSPTELPFLPRQDILSIGMDFENYWAPLQGNQEGNSLVFRTIIHPTCPLRIESTYHWNGLYFASTTRLIEFQDLPDELWNCGPIIDHAIHHWGPETTASLVETLMPWWPPEKDEEGKSFPPDALDEMRFRLGIYQALLGRSSQAITILSDLSTHPSTLDSAWIEPAQRFLSAYQKPEDIYQACQLAPLCNPSLAIQLLVDQIPNQVDAFALLRQWQIEIVSSGYFDFDQDDVRDRWFTVRNTPGQKLDFWILTRGASYHRAVRVGVVETRLPTLQLIEEAYIADEGLDYQPAVNLDGKFAFSLQRLPNTLDPYLVQVPLRKEYPSRFFVPLMGYKKSLFGGASPELIQKELSNLQDFPGLLCKSSWSCDEYFYLLGLASELANDGITAVKNYQRLWLDYSKSPYTQMARLKLTQVVEAPLPSPIPSSTPIPSLPAVTNTVTIPTNTATITPTGTLFTSTPTGTITTETPTITATLTPTSDDYPAPTFSSPTPYP